MMPTILPTHTCFDDALEYLTARVKADPRLARGRRLLLVHGIALMPEGQPDAGEPFAHAWVEDAGHCVTMGLLDGARVLIRYKRADFYRRLRIRQTTTYTVRQAWRENRRTAMYGPWRPEYLALCRNHLGDEARAYCGAYILVRDQDGHIYRATTLRATDTVVPHSTDNDGFLLPRYWSLPRR